MKSRHRSTHAAQIRRSKSRPPSARPMPALTTTAKLLRRVLHVAFCDPRNLMLAYRAPCDVGL